MPMKQLQSIDIECLIDETFEYTTAMAAEWSSMWWRNAYWNR